MNQHSFLQSQVTQLRRLLAGARDNPILAPQLQQRLEDVEGELKTLESRVQVTTLRPIGGAPRVTYLLLDAKPEEPATVSVPESPA